MGTFVFILGLGLAVLVSSAINKVVRGVSTPLIQIGIGVLLALVGFSTSNFTIDPELFLVLFIAPLLFDEARSVDKVALWTNRAKVVSLAVCLVVVTLLCVGFTLNFLEPSIPLAAAFALGAALGPTDAVAVTSLPQKSSMKKKQSILLSGECLINDASGVVSFQFAVAALTTGTFSLMDASFSFAKSFFGGILMGLLCAAILAFLVSRVRNMGLEDTTFHVLVDVLTPFIVFLAAESIHVSGILAVVAAGLVHSFLHRDMGPEVARMKIVSSSVWKILNFVLNGVVFVLLGIQLPHAMTDTWEERSVSNPELLGLVLLIAAITIVVRALWFLALNFIDRKRRAHQEQKNSGGTPEQVKRVVRSVKLFTKESLTESMAMSLAGPKGAVTLSIMFTFPYAIGASTPFSQRDFLIFLASGVILVTLLLANFVLPLLLPQPKKKPVVDQTQVSVDVLRTVIEELAARQTRENRRATQVVMQQYNDRIDRVKQGVEGFEGDDSHLRMQMLKWQEELVLDAMEGEEVSSMVGYRALKRIHHSMDLVTRKRDTWWLVGLARRRASLFGRSLTRALVDKKPFKDALEKEREAHDFHVRELEHVMQKLRACLNDPGYKTEHVSALMVEVQKSLRRLKRTSSDLATVARIEDKAMEVRRVGYLLELEEIQRMFEAGRIDRATLKHMRENVHMMQLDLEDKV